MQKELIKLLLNEIKQKKQIESLEDSYVLDKINSYFLTNGDIRKKLEIDFKIKGEKIIKSKKFKQILKDIREIIGQVYGQFLTNEFLKKKKILESEDNINNLLKLHKSTRERIDFYTEIYNKIFKFYKPKKIADLACGLNPLSYYLIEKELNYSPTYFASDLNPEDMNFLNKFFKKNNILGIAKNYDLTKLEFIENEDFIESDLVILFKALDSLEEIKKNISKELLIKLPQKYIVISFPTRSIKAKIKFKNTQKGWLKKIIEENNWTYEQFEVYNEIFFLIKKNVQ